MRLNDKGKTVIRPQYIISMSIIEAFKDDLRLELTLPDKDAIWLHYGSNAHIMQQDYDSICKEIEPVVLQYKGKPGEILC